MAYIVPSPQGYDVCIGHTVLSSHRSLLSARTALAALRT